MPFLLSLSFFYAPPTPLITSSGAIDKKVFMPGGKYHNCRQLAGHIAGSPPNQNTVITRPMTPLKYLETPLLTPAKILDYGLCVDGV